MREGVYALELPGGEEIALRLDLETEGRESRARVAALYRGGSGAGVDLLLRNVPARAARERHGDGAVALGGVPPPFRPRPYAPTLRLLHPPSATPFPPLRRRPSQPAFLGPENLRTEEE